MDLATAFNIHFFRAKMNELEIFRAEVNDWKPFRTKMNDSEIIRAENYLRRGYHKLWALAEKTLGEDLGSKVMQKNNFPDMPERVKAETLLKENGFVHPFIHSDSNPKFKPPGP